MAPVRRLVTAIILGTISLIPALHAAASATPADDVAGQWDFLVVVKCLPSAGMACTDVLPPWIDLLINGVEMQCTDASHCAFRAYLLVHGTGESGAPTACGPDVSNGPFRGTCRDTETGTMFVKLGGLGIPEFFVSEETASYVGEGNAPPVLNVHDPAGESNYPLETGTPAVPGFYDTAKNLQLGGVIKPGETVPAGIEVNIVVMYTPPGASVISPALAVPVIMPGTGKGTSAAFPPGCGAPQVSARTGATYPFGSCCCSLRPGWGAHIR